MCLIFKGNKDHIPGTLDNIEPGDQLHRCSLGIGPAHDGLVQVHGAVKEDHAFEQGAEHGAQGPEDAYPVQITLQEGVVGALGLLSRDGFGRHLEPLQRRSQVVGKAFQAVLAHPAKHGRNRWGSRVQSFLYHEFLLSKIK